jgi:hypothetical protein
MRVRNKKIKYLRISIDQNHDAKVVEDCEIDVIGENDKHIVIDDSLFTRLDKEKVKRGHHQFSQYVGEIKISDYTKDDYFRKRWGNFVVSVYHYGQSKKILQNKINREINKYIEKKIGRYMPFRKCNIVL